MPRPKPTRSVGAERNLVERIRREMRSRGWSPADLSHQMTAAGCGIGVSSVYKILDKEKPRSIPVDEFVTLAKVFNTTPDDLLTPVEALDQERAKEILDELTSSFAAQEAARRAYGEAMNKLVEMKDSAPEFYEYVMNQHFAKSLDPTRLGDGFRYREIYEAAMKYRQQTNLTEEDQ